MRLRTYGIALRTIIRAYQASFAASHVRRQPAHGNFACPATLGADRVLAAAKTSVDLAIHEQRCFPVLRAERDPGEAAAKVRKLTPWQEFLREGLQNGKKTMKACALGWKSAPEEQRLAAQRERPQADDLRPTLCTPKIIAPFPYCGDEFYPIREELAEDLPAKVRELSSEWVARLGDQVIKPGAAFQAPWIQTCEEIPGRGRCIDTAEKAAVQRLLDLQKRLDRWSAFNKPTPASLDGLWTLPPLFYVGQLPGTAAEGSPAGIAALLLFPRLKNQVLHLEPCAAPAVGSTISLQPDPAKPKTNVDFIRAWAASPGSAALQLKYRPVSLTRMEVISVETMGDVEARHAQQRAQAREAGMLAGLIKGLDGSSRKSHSQASRQAGGRSHSTAAQTGEPGAAEMNHDPMDVLDEEIHNDPALVDPLDAAGDYSELLGMIPDSARAEMLAEILDTELAGEADVDAGAFAESGSSAGEDDDRDHELLLPVLDATSGQVTNPENAADIWGRISLVKQNTPQEAVSLYCRRHGCSIMRTSRTVPPTEHLLKWFLRGQDIDAGHTAANKSKHKAMFNDL